MGVRKSRLFLRIWGCSERRFSDPTSLFLDLKKFDTDFKKFKFFLTLFISGGDLVEYPKSGSTAWQIEELWKDLYDMVSGQVNLSYEEFRQSFSGTRIEDLKKFYIELKGNVKVNGEDYHPSGEIEANFYIQGDLCGNPFSPWYKFKKGRKLREELLEPKNI